VRLLLDTHVLLWALSAPETLASQALAAIRAGSNEVFVSAASLWEISIKMAAGKLAAPGDLLGAIDAAGLISLPIGPDDAMAAGSLPPHHRDPFDRMLVAQARGRGLLLVTRDARLADYGIPILAA
jgi:PIN domain nuclease of toxin-antitoxin system